MVDAAVDARSLIDDLYLAYTETLDDGELATWPELFTDDGEYHIVAKENRDRGLPLALMRCESKGMIEDRVNAILQLSMYQPRVLRHLVSSLHVRPAPADAAGPSDAGQYDVTANYAVFQTLPDEATTVLSTGRYLDVVSVGRDKARFRRKVCVYDNPLVPNSLVYPL